MNHGVFFVPKSPEAPWRSPTAKERVRHLDEARGVRGALCGSLGDVASSAGAGTEELSFWGAKMRILRFA